LECANKGTLAFKRTVVLRYRFFLEQKNFAPSTINVRLAAVRRLAYEALETGLLSPDLAAGIQRVKGAKRLGIRIGNWLTVDPSKSLLLVSPSHRRQIGCGQFSFEHAGLILEQAGGNHVPTDSFPFCGAKRFKRFGQRIATDALKRDRALQTAEIR